MVTRNKTVFGLLVLAIVCGVVAGRGATQAQAASTPPGGYTVPKADCKTPACNALIWGDPPTTPGGTVLPAGSCTMSSQAMRLCVADPLLDCIATANVPNGCPGTFQVVGEPGYFLCYQAINRC